MAHDNNAKTSTSSEQNLGRNDDELFKNSKDDHRHPAHGEGQQELSIPSTPGPFESKQVTRFTQTEFPCVQNKKVQANISVEKKSIKSQTYLTIASTPLTSKERLPLEGQLVPGVALCTAGLQSEKASEDTFTNFDNMPTEVNDDMLTNIHEEVLLDNHSIENESMTDSSKNSPDSDESDEEVYTPSSTDSDDQESEDAADVMYHSTDKIIILLSTKSAEQQLKFVVFDEAIVKAFQHCPYCVSIGSVKLVQNLGFTFTYQVSFSKFATLVFSRSI